MLRRMFAGMLGAAPLAAAASVKAQVPLAGSLEPAPTWMLDQARPITPPPALKDFWSAVQTRREQDAYRRKLGDAHEHVARYAMPPSIACLKSVSHVHKHHMMAQRMIALEKAEQSFTEMLKDSLGLREWFDKRDSLGGEAGESSGF